MKAVVLSVDFEGELIRSVFYTPKRNHPRGPIQEAVEVLPNSERAYPQREWSVCGDEEAKELWGKYKGKYKGEMR